MATSLDIAVNAENKWRLESPGVTGWAKAKSIS
jgi:hypothetical protein